MLEGHLLAHECYLYMLYVVFMFIELEKRHFKKKIREWG